jgi:cyanophycinase-like exopeptidase
MIMKKFLSLFLACTMVFIATTLPKQGQSQIVHQLTISAADDTLVNADTAFVTVSIDATYKSVEGLVQKVSGTVAGTVVFQGQSLDGGSWVDIDSLTLTDVASQYKIFSVPTVRTHKAYRLRFITSGTNSVKPKAYTLRYTGS